MERLRLKSLLALVIVLATAVAAWAFYSTAGSGTASGTVGNMTAPVVTVPATSTGSHTVSWTAATLSGSPPEASEITYAVQRKLESDTEFVSIGSGGCAPAFDAATLSCTDSVGASGDYVYRVVAEFRSWTAASAAAGPVEVTVGGGDTTAPDVQSIVRAGTSPTNAGSVDFTVTFSENVSGVDVSDFDVAETGVAGASVDSVTGGDDEYTVTVDTGTGDGTLGLDLDDDDSIVDGAANKLGGTGADNGDFTGETYVIDRTAPTVQSITRVVASPTNATSVQFAVTFSEGVSGVEVGDFALVASGVAGASITGVTGSDASYTVTVNTGSGSGSLGLNLVDDDSIADTATNVLGGAGTANGNLTGEVYVIDKAAPAVQSINRSTSSPTNASSVQWAVSFSESVSGVDADDFALATSGVSGASITGVTGSGSSYTVTASTGSGDGSLGLNLADDDSIADTATNKLGGAGTGNGNFTGQTYTTDKTAPTAASIERASGTPTNASSVQWTVTFSESVSGVGSADFAVAASGVSGASITGVTGSGSSYTVTASSGSGSGSLGLNLVDDDSIQDGATNRLGGTGTGNGNFTGEVYAVDRTAPTVVGITRDNTNPTNAASVSWTVEISESVTGLTQSDFLLSQASGVSGASITGFSGSGDTYTITANTGSGSGLVNVTLMDDDSVVDAVGNPLYGPGANNFVSQTYTIDKTGPELETLTMLDENNDGRIDKVEAAFDEALTGSGTTNAGWTTNNRPGGVALGSTVTIAGSTASLAFTGGTAGANSTAVGSFTITLSDTTGNIRDALGNKSSFPAQAPTDGASPVPTALTDTPGANNGRFQAGDTAILTFTENVTNTVTDSDVVLEDPSGNASLSDVWEAPGFLGLDGSSRTSLGGPNYQTSNNGTTEFDSSDLDQPAANQIRLELAACSSGCSGVGTQGSATAVGVIPSTTIKDAANNSAKPNSAAATFSIQLF